MIDLEKIEALAKAAPAGQWEVWTSNSWRRVLSRQDGGNVRVIEPTVQRHDNHPDLMFGEGVREYLEGVTPDVVLALIAEVRALRIDNAKLLRSGQMMGTIMHNNTVAMQAAWIEWQYGEGPEGAMEWIENTLEGPGLIPEPDEPHSTEAQAYFDANKSDRMYDPAIDVAIDAARGKS